MKVTKVQITIATLIVLSAIITIYGIYSEVKWMQYLGFVIFGIALVMLIIRAFISESSKH